MRSPDAPDDEIDLRALLATVLRERQLVALVAAAVFALGVVYAWLAPPLYRADALVQVEDTGGSALGAAVQDLSGLLDTPSKAVTEIEILRSRMVLGRAVDELDLQVEEAPRHFPLLGRALARSGHFAFLQEVLGQYAWQPVRAQVSGLVLPAAWSEQCLRLVAGKAGAFTVLDPDGRTLGRGRVGQPWRATTAAGGVALLVRELNAPPGVQVDVSLRPRAQAIADLAEALGAAEKGKQSGIIALTLSHADPREAAARLDAIARHYARQNTERTAAEADQTLRFLDGQLPQMKRQLEAVESRFNAYRSRNAVTDIDKEGELLLGEAMRTEAGLVELRQKRSELLQRFTAEHPSVKAVDNAIAVLEQQRQRLSGRVDRLPQTQQEILRLTRDLKVQQEMYAGMLNNAQQLKVVRSGTVGNVRVIDYAEVPLQPVAPRRGLIVLGSLLLGLLLGLAAAFLRQLQRRGVKDAHEVEAATGLPVYATVPVSARQQALAGASGRAAAATSLLARVDDQDLAIESLRSLRTALRFASHGAGNNRLLVCGPAPEIGKSFVAVNFAAVMAAGGERVVVVDADVRRGNLHRHFGLRRQGGLTEVITGDVALDAALHATSIPGLDLLCTGSIPPNPAELLMHPNFSRLLEQLSERYDRVLIDCPPIMAVTDAAIVGRHAGSVLMVARYGDTPLQQILDAIGQMRLAGVTVNGLVLNCVETGTGYSYDYRYAYRSLQES